MIHKMKTYQIQRKTNKNKVEWDNSNNKIKENSSIEKK